MFELKDGQDYSVYNNLTEDPFTWKQYNSSANLRYNKHGMMELVLDTRDATLLGSDQSIEKMIEVINRYQITYRKDYLRMDAYKKCLNTTSCAIIVNEKPANIINAHYKSIYDRVNGRRMATSKNKYTIDMANEAA